MKQVPKLWVRQARAWGSGPCPLPQRGGAQGAGRDWSPGMKLLGESGWAPPDTSVISRGSQSS